MGSLLKLVIMKFVTNHANRRLSLLLPSTSSWATILLHLTMITSEYA